MTKTYICIGLFESSHRSTDQALPKWILGEGSNSENSYMSRPRSSNNRISLTSSRKLMPIFEVVHIHILGNCKALFLLEAWHFDVKKKSIPNLIIAGVILRCMH